MTIVMWTKPVVILHHTLYVATPAHHIYEPNGEEIFYFFPFFWIIFFLYVDLMNLISTLFVGRAMQMVAVISCNKHFAFLIDDESRKKMNETK